jgi:hypothetical protein
LAGGFGALLFFTGATRFAVLARLAGLAGLVGLVGFGAFLVMISLL